VLDLTSEKLTGSPFDNKRDIPVLWKRLEKVLRKAAPELEKRLRKPATEEELTEVERLIGLTLPDDFKASYLIHNGQRDDVEEAFVPEDWLGEPYYLMPLPEVSGEWKSWKGLVDVDEFKGRECSPGEGIRPDWWHPGWVPFIGNGAGDSLCMDLAPAAAGKKGQVIQMSHESGEAWRAG
jgi:cell wall assembly regulator SMI1